MDPCGLSAYALIHQRRSAVEMDGETELDRLRFYAMIARTTPTPGAMPWDMLGHAPAVHLGLFVHRIRDLRPGLYLLARDPEALEMLRNAMRPNFDWDRPEGCPTDLPLYRLAGTDCRQVAGALSCQQAIAADGAFSLGMFADFQSVIEAEGPWSYRRLFWETGMIGQTLYLEAEAAGLRGTGIGCFFDDAVHDVFGLKNHRFQSLYNFTVGGPVEDTRLTTLPPYPAGRRGVD
jgi:hypothetical protein